MQVGSVPWHWPASYESYNLPAIKLPKRFIQNKANLQIPCLSIAQVASGHVAPLVGSLLTVL